jgi:hypothetical protein
VVTAVVVAGVAKAAVGVGVRGVAVREGVGRAVEVAVTALPTLLLLLHLLLLLRLLLLLLLELHQVPRQSSLLLQPLQLRLFLLRHATHVQPCGRWLLCRRSRPCLGLAGTAGACRHCMTCGSCCA